MSLSTMLRDFVTFIHPFTRLRNERKEWLKSVTLPDCDLSRVDNRCRDIPLQIHPLIDQYLSFSEARQLLIKHGWVRPIGNGKCIMPKDQHAMMKAFHQHLSTASWMAIAKPEWQLWYLGLDYNDL